jgi:hypothetical protein
MPRLGLPVLLALSALTTLLAALSRLVGLVLLAALFAAAALLAGFVGLVLLATLILLICAFVFHFARFLMECRHQHKLPGKGYVPLALRLRSSISKTAFGP